MTTGYYLAVAFFCLMIIFAIAVLVKYIKLKSLRTRAEETFMYMETYMQHRHEAIPKFVSVSKVFMVGCDDIFDGVVNARNEATRARSRENKVIAEKHLQDALNGMFNTIINYPNLEADMEFEEIFGKMRTIESQVARTRLAYNHAVENYNVKLKGLMGGIAIRLLGFEREEPFDRQETSLKSEYQL